MTPELRLIRYFIAVAELGNITHAAVRLDISQPSLSAAVKQLEAQLGTQLLARHGRRVSVTPAGDLLMRRGRELLAQADALVDDIRREDAAAVGRLELGLSPTARYDIGPKLLALCAAEAPAVMLYTREDTTGVLLRDVADGRLDIAITFCAADPPPGVELALLADEPAVVHLPADHPLAGRPVLTLPDLVDETILVAASSASGGFSERVRSAFAREGITPRTRPDPYPDLGLQAVRERLGVVVYVRTAFPPNLEGSAFVPIEPQLGLPFHLAYSKRRKNAALKRILAIVGNAHSDGSHATARSPRAN